jgi:hypothetical protein
MAKYEDPSPIQGPIILSQSYLIGVRAPGDTVLPVRMVLDTTGAIVVRCVGLRAGGHGCNEHWTVGHIYGGSPVSPSPLSLVLTHLELFHGQR